MAESQSRPSPKAQCFIVCREILEDRRTGEFVLIGPRNRGASSAFPFLYRCSLFCYLTSGHGTYSMSLDLRNGDDNSIWDYAWEQMIQIDPIGSHSLALYDAEWIIPAPGRYDLLLLADGDEIARHLLHFQFADQTT